MSRRQENGSKQRVTSVRRSDERRVKPKSGLGRSPGRGSRSGWVVWVAWSPRVQLHPPAPRRDACRADVRLPTRTRRTPRSQRDRGPRLSPRVRLGGGRIPRCLGLLHPVGIPDHRGAAHARARCADRSAHADLLATSGPASAAGRLGVHRLHAAAGRQRSVRERGHRRRCDRRVGQRGQLAPHLRRHQLLRSLHRAECLPAVLVTRHRGAVLHRAPAALVVRGAAAPGAATARGPRRVGRGVDRVAGVPRSRRSRVLRNRHRVPPSSSSVWWPQRRCSAGTSGPRAGSDDRSVMRATPDSSFWC